MGTTKICCVIADWSPVGNLDIIGVGVSPSRGLRKGVVVNIDSTVESIKHAVAEAEEMAGVEIPSVIAGVAGGHIRGINSRGVVAVSGKHREVSQTDIDRALDAPSYNLVLHSAPFDPSDAVDASYHWHIEVLPRVTKTAGFEWGSGFHINTTRPEDAARRLKDLAT